MLPRRPGSAAGEETPSKIRPGGATQPPPQQFATSRPAAATTAAQAPSLSKEQIALRTAETQRAALKIQSAIRGAKARDGGPTSAQCHACRSFSRAVRAFTGACAAGAASYRA